MAVNTRNFLLSISIALLVESIFLGLPALAQESKPTRVGNIVSIHELGFGLGGMNYQGDISPRYRLLNNRPSLELFYKKVISQPLSLRVALLMGRYAADDRSVMQKLPFHKYRRADISGNIFELAVGVEYNFLDHYDFKRLTRWTPYFFATPGVVHYKVKRDGGQPNNPKDGNTTNKSTDIMFALGPGVKLALNRNWNLGIEYGPRIVLTTDFLDDLSPKDKFGHALSNPYTADWYFFTGATLTYSIYRTKCPKIYHKRAPEILN
jgi:hypothetical protein